MGSQEGPCPGLGAGGVPLLAGGGAAAKYQQLRLAEVTPAGREAVSQRLGEAPPSGTSRTPLRSPSDAHLVAGTNPDQGRQDIAMPSRMAKDYQTWTGLAEASKM